MKYILLKRFTAQLESSPILTQKKFWKQLKFLLRDIRHPSLNAKKYDEKRDIWQARVDDNYRFYFLIKSDAYILLEVKPHPKH